MIAFVKDVGRFALSHPLYVVIPLASLWGLFAALIIFIR